LLEDRADYDSAVIELRELTDDGQEIAERFWQFFLHDLSEFRDSHPDEHGAFRRRHLEPYLVEDRDRVAYLVYRPTGPVGFAFVYGLADRVRRFDQFFIVRSQRRGGVGRVAAETTISRHPGRWEVGFQNENPIAARFWRRLAADVGSDVQERMQPVPDKPHIPDDVILSFEVGPVDRLPGKRPDPGSPTTSTAV
jgi:predicted acetyltransferase